MAGRSGPVYLTGIGPIVSAYSVTSYVCSGSYTPDGATGIYKANSLFRTIPQVLLPLADIYS